MANARGRVQIQIRDLDQTAIGNPANDLIRLALSLATASRGSDLPGVTTARILEQMIGGYEEALEREEDDPHSSPGLARTQSRVRSRLLIAVGKRPYGIFHRCSRRC